MIEPRLASNIVVSALLRKTQNSGGHAMVIARGDDIAGAILLILIDRGRIVGLRERVWRFDGGYAVEPAGPSVDQEDAAINDYIDRRRHSDPDLWVVEIDHPEAEALAIGIC